MTIAALLDLSATLVTYTLLVAYCDWFALIPMTRRLEYALFVPLAIFWPGAAIYAVWRWWRRERAWRALDKRLEVERVAGRNPRSRP